MVENTRRGAWRTNRTPPAKLPVLADGTVPGLAWTIGRYKADRDAPHRHELIVVPWTHQISDDHAGPLCQIDGGLELACRLRLDPLEVSVAAL